MRTMLSLSFLFVALILISPSVAADEASPAASPELCLAPAVSEPATPAPSLGVPEAEPMDHCQFLCPAEEFFCSQNSDCNAVCPCGGRCVHPFLQICAYRTTLQLQPHCECDTASDP